MGSEMCIRDRSKTKHCRRDLTPFLVIMAILVDFVRFFANITAFLMRLCAVVDAILGGVGLFLRHFRRDIG